MLSSISIKNYALIDSLDIHFETGLNSMTGETGAGKSIILGALGLILGQRADTSVLRDKDKKCVVEGTFNIEGYQLEPFFEENELDYEDSSVLRREITTSGTSRAFINDTPVSVKTLRELGLQLVDIHSQHQNLELGNNHFQLRIVDMVAGNDSALKSYALVFNSYKAAEKELEGLESLAAQSKADLDYYQFQHQQLEEARLKDGEQKELEAELDRLTHAEEIQSAFSRLAYMLDGEEPGILAQMKEQSSQLNKLKDFLSDAENLANRIQSSYLELKDIAAEATLIAEKAESNPERLEFINQRLDLIYSLQQKHRVQTVEELLGIFRELDAKIQQVSTYDEQIGKLKNHIADLNKQLRDLSDQLHISRKAVVEPIASKVVGMLQNLGIVNASFTIQFKPTSQFTETGTDTASFLFSANKSSVPEDISKVASGGEMSRLMLAIKTLITDAKALPTIVFDEIDTGISGEVAIKVGQILKQLSQSIQVINITHLPQIAAKGKHHYKVFKYDEGEKTFTSIKKLTDDERLVELATMLSGANYSDKAIETARELLHD